MLSSISWQQYIAALALIGTVYYSYVLLRYYQQEIAQLFGKKKTIPATQFGTPATTFEVMGAAKKDPHISIIDDQELQFADEGPDLKETVTVPAENEIKKAGSPQEQLLQETDQLIAAFADVDDRAEFISLVKILFVGYLKCNAAIDKDLFTAHVIDRSRSILPFQIAADDLTL